MNPNVGMPNMNPMAGPVGGAPMPMMNNGAVNPQVMAAAVAANNGGRPGPGSDDNKKFLNTYIYEYFIRYGLHDCARALLNSDAQINVKDGKRRRDENGNLINGMDDAMETDSKDDIDSKLPDDLPQPALPMTSSETSFLLEWFCLFFDMYHAQRQKSGNGHINQYVAHTQQQSRLKQNQQQEMFRGLPQYQQLMRNNMNQMGMMKPGSNQLARTAIANNQNNPQMQMMPGKQNPMQRDPSGMDANRERPSSPASGDNAPSPSKRQRVEGGAPFNPQQGMMPNGRQGPVQHQIAGNPQAAAAHQMLAANGINPTTLNPQQFQSFVNSGPSAQQKSIATYAQNMQAQQQNQMGNKPLNAGPQGQGSPMMNGPDGNALQFAYNANEIGGPGGIRPGPNGQQAAGSNHALQDYQMQLMLLEQQNKKRLMMARQEQDSMGPMGRDGQPPGAPGAPGQPATGPNGQPFPESSPQTMRSGTSPNPTEQMKRGTPQMNNSGIPSPIPEGGQSRGSPNPMNFMGGGDPNMGPGFNMNAQGQMAGMRPPSSHPGQPGFNGQMNAQAMMARQQAAQAGQANPQQWQQGPNGQMIPMQPGTQPVQGTPQQQNRSMPPPSAPAAAANNANRTTASPQQAAAAPPTPNQGNKAGPKKKESKAGNKKGGKKGANANANANANTNANTNATPAGDNNNNDSGEAPTPATPITPANGGNFKNGQNGAQAPNGNAPAQPVATANGGQPGTLDPNADGGMPLDNMGMFNSLEFTNPMHSNDVLNDFDFDSFLHDGDGSTEQFDFNAFGPLEGNEIGAD